jgi:hypothetical protein
MIACISPNDLFLDENLSTLAYATKASQIKNEPIVNYKTKLMTLTKNYKKPTETMKSVSKWYRLREIWMSSWKGLDSRYKRWRRTSQKVEHLKVTLTGTCWLRALIWLETYSRTIVSCESRHNDTRFYWIKGICRCMKCSRKTKSSGINFIRIL